MGKEGLNILTRTGHSEFKSVTYITILRKRIAEQLVGRIIRGKRNLELRRIGSSEET